MKPGSLEVTGGTKPTRNRTTGPAAVVRAAWRPRNHDSPVTRKSTAFALNYCLDVVQSDPAQWTDYDNDEVRRDFTVMAGALSMEATIRNRIFLSPHGVPAFA